MSKAELMSHAFVWCSFGGFEKFNLPVFVILFYFFYFFVFVFIDCSCMSAFIFYLDIRSNIFDVLAWCFSAVWFTATLQHWWTHNHRQIILDQFKCYWWLQSISSIKTFDCNWCVNLSCSSTHCSGQEMRELNDSDDNSNPVTSHYELKFD